MDTWRTPLYYRLPLYALGMLVGIRVGDADGIRALRELISTHPGQHVVPGHRGDELSRTRGALRWQGVSLPG
jgi:hypothetical protein